MDFPIYETGGFGGQMLIGAFDPKPESFRHTKQYFGMSQNQHHLYGKLTTESGKDFMFLRDIAGWTTGGLMIQYANDEGYFIDPRGGECQRGGTIQRIFKDGVDQAIGFESFGFSGDVPTPTFIFNNAYDSCVWKEKDMLEVQGTRICPGWKYLMPLRHPETGEDNSHFATFVTFEIAGQIFGEPAKGFVISERDYTPVGRIFQDLGASKQGKSFLSFALEYDDGAMEFGTFMFKDGMRHAYGSVLNKDGIAMQSYNMEMGDIEWGDDGFPKYFTYTDKETGEVWEFINDPNGKLIDFVKMSYGVRFHNGITRRKGESREIVRYYSWGEIHPQKLGFEGDLQLKV